MQEKIVTAVKKLTDQKFLNLYEVTYNDGVRWTVCSRADINPQNFMQMSNKVDAVRMLPHFKKHGQDHVVVINEFRHACGKFVWGCLQAA